MLQHFRLPDRGLGGRGGGFGLCLCTVHLAPADMLFSFSSCISVSGALGWASIRKWGIFSIFFHPWGFTSQFCWFAFAVLHWFSYLSPFCCLICALAFKCHSFPFLSSSSSLPCFPLQSQCPGGFVFGCFLFPLQAFPFVFADHLQQRPCVV